jgi:hypothetical protein
MFKLKFETDNAAFVDGGIDEVSDILQGICKMIYRGETDGLVHDTNGNKIGKWSMDLPEQDDDDANYFDDPADTPDDTPSLDTSFHDHEMDVDDKHDAKRNGDWPNRDDEKLCYDGDSVFVLIPRR